MEVQTMVQFFRKSQSRMLNRLEDSRFSGLIRSSWNRTGRGHGLDKTIESDFFETGNETGRRIF